MNTTRKTGTVLMAALLFTVVDSSGAAEPEAPRRDHLVQGGDPYVPPAQRSAAPQASPSRAELAAVVSRKLRQTFDAADAGARGSLTLDEARQAGWALVSENFTAIDVRRSGRVTFGDIERYLQRRNTAR